MTPSFTPYSRLPLLLAFLLLTSLLYADPQARVRGRVYDAETRLPLEGARLELPALNRTAYSDKLGMFSLADLPAGEYTLTVSYLGYAALQVQVLAQSGGAPSLDIALQPADLQIAEITIANQPSALGALHSISSLDLQLRPLRSSQDALRAVPGLFIAQHAGGGKAEQIFLRGFDIDHGTDINLTVDGMPVNMVSHAHGQGYADLHFLIPETIERIDFDKGPYESNRGNFTTAGYAAFQTRNAIDRSQFKLEAGQFNTLRGVALIDLLPGQENHHAYAASEYLYSDGYFEASQRFSRLNFMAKYTGLVAEDAVLSVTASHFTSQWDASGQIPLRAVERGQIGHFGAIDTTEGGATGRSNFNLLLTQFRPDGSILENRLFFSRYDFSLFSNFTFFLEDSLNGDQIHQRESRRIYGYQGSWRRMWEWKGLQMTSQAGLDLRADEVMGNELSRTANRTTLLEPLALGDVLELNAAAWASQRMQAGAFSVEAGIRYDQFRYQYQNALTVPYDPQSAAKGLLSPKLKLSWQAAPQLRFYLHAGTGFHSNDTRVILADRSREILPRAYGSDLGLVAKPLPGMLLQAAVWTLRLDQEFVYVGDAAVVEPSGRTQRMGADLSVRYQLARWLFADADLNYTAAQAVGEAEGEDYIPLAPRWSSIGGLSFRWEDSWNLSLRYRFLGDRPANEDYSLTAEGYTLFDAVLRYARPRYELSLAAENLANVQWREAQFETESRLRGEDLPVSEIHYTPGTPLFVRLTCSYFF